MYIESYNSALLRDVTVNITEQSEAWQMSLRLYYETSRPNSFVRGLLTTDFIADTSKSISRTSVSGTADETGELVQDITLLIRKVSYKMNHIVIVCFTYNNLENLVG